MTPPVKPRRVVLTDAALGALTDSLTAHLAGEEGEGDLAEVKFDDLRRALAWATAERERRAVRRARRRK